MFPISRDPPEGGTSIITTPNAFTCWLFPISRDPPEGGTCLMKATRLNIAKFPISRDPPEGGTVCRYRGYWLVLEVSNF